MVTGRSELRRRCGYTLRQLSKDSAVSVSQLSGWERDEVTLPEESVMRVAFALYFSAKETPRFDTVQAMAQYLSKGND